MFVYSRGITPHTKPRENVKIILLDLSVIALLLQCFSLGNNTFLMNYIIL